MDLSQKQVGRFQPSPLIHEQSAFTVSNSTQRVMKLRADIENTCDEVAQAFDRLHGPRPRAGQALSKDGPAPVIGELEELCRALDLLEGIWGSLRDNLDALKAV